MADTASTFIQLPAVDPNAPMPPLRAGRESAESEYGRQQSQSAPKPAAASNKDTSSLGSGSKPSTAASTAAVHSSPQNAGPTPTAVSAASASTVPRPSSTSASYTRVSHPNQADVFNTNPNFSSLDALLQAVPIAGIFKKAQKNIRPWNEFFNVQLFNVAAYSSTQQRIARNFRYFIYNYLCVYFTFVIICIFLMPFLLLLIVALVAALVYLSHQSDTISFRDYSVSTTYARWLSVILFFVLFIATVRPAVFFLFCFTFIAIGVHCVFHVGQKYEKLQADNYFDDV